MAQGKAGQGIDDWIASLSKNGRVPKTKSYEPQDPRIHDAKQAIDNLIHRLTGAGYNEGDVGAQDTPGQRNYLADLDAQQRAWYVQSLGGKRFDQKKGEVGERYDEMPDPGPARVEGQILRGNQGAARGTGAPRSGTTLSQDAGSALEKLLQYIGNELKGKPQPRDPKDYGPDMPSPEDERWYRDVSATEKLKKAGKPGKPLNRGLF